jgi:hypothetical protein
MNKFQQKVDSGLASLPPAPVNKSSAEYLEWKLKLVDHSIKLQNFIMPILLNARTPSAIQKRKSKLTSNVIATTNRMADYLNGISEV